MIGNRDLTVKELENRAKALDAFQGAQGQDYDLAYEQQQAQLEEARVAALLRDYHRSKIIAGSPELQEALVLVTQDPKSPEGRKAKALLFAAGLHNPQGSTVDPLEITATPRTVSYVPREHRFAVAEVVVFGHVKVARDILGKIAARVGEQSVVVSKKDIENGGASFFLNAVPTRAEATALQQIGAGAYKICPEGNRTSSVLGSPSVERRI